MLPTSTLAWLALFATIAGGVLSYLVGYVAAGREADTPRVRGYTRYIFAAGTWAFAYTLVLLSPNAMVAFWFDVVRAAAAVATAWFFVIFVVNYTGNRDRLEKPLLQLFVVDLVLYTAVYATQRQHGLLFTRFEAVDIDGLTVLVQDPSLLFTLHFVAVMIPVLYSFVLLARFLFATRNVFREQTAALLVGFVITVAAAIAVGFNLAGSGNWQYFDPTPVTFALNGLVIGWALFRLDFLTVGPLAANTLIEEMTDAVFVVDEDGVIVDANPMADTLLASTGDRATPSNVDGAAGGGGVGDALAAVLPSVADAVDAGGTVELPTPVRANTDDPSVGDADAAMPEGGAGTDGGTEVASAIYDVQVTPLFDQYDVERGRLVVLRDVTERIERERLLERRNEQLDDFTRVVSHDLRNPLGVAKGYAELARRTQDPEDVKEIELALDRMDELVEDLLTLARNEREPVSPEPVSVAGSAEAAWESVDTEDASLTVGVDGGGMVVADRSRFQQLLENLFRNAVEHGGPDASVVVTADEAAGEIAVADDGPGIPPDERDAVFESGYSTSEDGTGYGLSIVESVAEAHDWTVGVTASDAGGTRFEFHGVDAPSDD